MQSQTDTKQTQENDFHEQIDFVRRGMTVEEAEEVRTEWEIPYTRFAEILGTSTRQWSRLKKNIAQSPRMGPVETDRLVRAKGILLHAGRLFENQEKAVKWMNLPNKALGGEIPMRLMDTDAGVRQIKTVLTRLEFGVYS